MSSNLSRRRFLAASAAVGTALTTSAPAAEPASRGEPFIYSLNTSTISGQKLPLPQEVDIAAQAGYRAIEPWIRELDQFVKEGGSLKDLRKQIHDKGLFVPSAIGFSSWVVDDEGERRKGLEEAKRSMDLVQQLGGKRLAAPPVGATKQDNLNLLRAAERYRALLELGDKMDVTPMVEVWGFSKSLSRLGETALVAIESRHPRACVLPDVYHLYKGGSDFDGVKVLSQFGIQVFHINDYPAMPGRADITDAHRIYPGDGIAPLPALLRDLHQIGYRGVLSLELFNRDYWKQDALVVARTGLEKVKAVVQKALTPAP
jgi:sugar phosphate isomerase/epimerase